MNLKLQALFALGLLVLLLVVIALDPRIPAYLSQYDDPASPAEVARWAQDVKRWPRSPTWQRFSPEAQGEPDWAASYIFGKYDYRVDVQVRGDVMHYISWGTDDQEGGGAWYAVGEGRLQQNGEWFSVWSCLDLSRAVSNGGGAWFKFTGDRKRIHVRYYHDTLPFGENPIELGEAVMVDLNPGQEMPADRAAVISESAWRQRMLEGRIRTRVETVTAPFVLWGRVVDENGEAIDGAAVKRRAAGRIEAVTDARGFFKLELDKLEALTLIAAGKLGYMNGIVTLEQDTAFAAVGPDRDTQKTALATITLRRMSRVDHREYQWVSPNPTLGASYDPAVHLSCGNCHRREHEAWRTSRHATMATNAWVVAAFSNDARPHAMNAGETRDDCTPCHSPSLASRLDHFHLNGTTLLNVQGVDRHGNHCDFCHKIEAVPLTSAPGMNGGIRLLRPDPADDTVPGGIKRVFGSLPDVSYLYMGAAYNPIFEMGLLCASCHEHQLDNGITGQGTYSEWKQTRYAKPGPDYQECQSCHMPQYTSGRITTVPGRDGRPMRVSVGGDLTSEEIGGGGAAIARFSTRYRPLNESHKHSFVGTDDVEFLRAGISMEVSSQPLTDGLRVTVKLTNTGAGHAVPTGHGLKRYVLAITARSGGQLLPAIQGLPETERVALAATATTGAVIGRQFAAASGGDWTVPYWRAEKVELDTRLWPDQPREFSFDIAGADAADVALIMRRGNPQLITSHGVDIGRPDGRVGTGVLDLEVHKASATR
jgi:hypothetical protein